MPTVVYFDLQGRAQMVRYALAATGKDFEDKRLTFPEWGPIKAAGTYGEGAQLPVYVDDDGKIFTQSVAICKMICFDNDMGPKNSAELHEAEMIYETGNDAFKGPGVMDGFFKDDADEAAITKSSDVLIGLMQKIEARFADGRAYSAGANPSWIDFHMLTTVTGFFTNQHLKHALMKEKLSAAYTGMTNFHRVIDNVKKLGKVQETVDNLRPSFL